MTATSKVLLTAIVGAAISLAPLSAQTPDNPNNATTTTHPYEEHHGMDWGWLGLGGLLGLLGLRRPTYTATTREYGTNRT